MDVVFELLVGPVEAVVPVTAVVLETTAIIVPPLPIAPKPPCPCVPRGERKDAAARASISRMFSQVGYKIRNLFSGRGWWFWVALAIIAGGVGWLFYVS